MPASTRASNGVEIHEGQIFRDARDSNVRTLRVDGFQPSGAYTRVVCTVIRQEYNGEVTEPMRETKIDADRLGSRYYIPID